MTTDQQLANLQIRNAELRAQLSAAEAKITKLYSMHTANQRHIDTLQRVIDSQKQTEAEKVFFNEQ